jgi:hypothetical protein
MQRIEVPLRDKSDGSASNAVAAVKGEWAAHARLVVKQGGYIRTLADTLQLDGEDSRLRWLAYKPPE